MTDQRESTAYSEEGAKDNSEVVYQITYDDSYERKSHNLLEAMRRECTYRPEEFTSDTWVVKKIFKGARANDYTTVTLGRDRECEFGVVPSEGYPFMYLSSIDRSGNVFIIARMFEKKDQDFVRSSNLPHMSELIGVMLSYYESLGVEPNGIYGTWSPNVDEGPQEMLNTNLLAFNAGLQEGMSAEEAAFSTPTGKSVQKFGYNKADVQLQELDNVVVLFNKRS